MVHSLTFLFLIFDTVQFKLDACSMHSNLGFLQSFLWRLVTTIELNNFRLFPVAGSINDSVVWKAMYWCTENQVGTRQVGCYLYYWYLPVFIFHYAPRPYRVCYSTCGTFSHINFIILISICNRCFTFLYLSLDAHIKLKIDNLDLASIYESCRNVTSICANRSWTV